MPCYRILVVDDSKLVHELVRYALSTVAGWSVVCGESGAQALQIVDAALPDAILLDVEMPGMDGPATAAELRRRGAVARTPIVFMTAHDDPAERARLDACDVSGVVAKPFDAEQLADDLCGMLGWAR
jgi:CheY-like chemotaxis protein